MDHQMEIVAMEAHKLQNHLKFLEGWADFLLMVFRQNQVRIRSEEQQLT